MGITLREFAKSVAELLLVSIKQIITRNDSFRKGTNKYRIDDLK